jgi:hypothetical protein
MYETGIWRSLYRWVARRPAAAGGEPFPYAGAVTPVLWAFIVVSAIEVPVVHLRMPWEVVRRVALVLGAYGVVWMIGMLASMRVHPHVVEPAGLRVRYGFAVDVLVPWERIAEVRYRMRALEGVRSIQVHGDGDTRVLSLGVGSQTTVDVVLREPVLLPVRQAAGEPVAQLRLHADDPRRLVTRLREGPRGPRPADETQGAR